MCVHSAKEICAPVKAKAIPVELQRLKTDEVGEPRGDGLHALVITITIIITIIGYSFYVIVWK